MIIATVILLLSVMAAAVYVFLIMPRVADTADMELQSTDYARGGLWNKNLPENSLPAFKSALLNGYGIELCIKLSQDGRVFVFRDNDLLRLCGVKGSISDYTASEIKKLTLLGSSISIPLLEEVFELVGGKVPLLIKIDGGRKKETEYTELCRKVSELLDTYDGAFAIESADPFVLSYFKQYRPRFARGQIVSGYKSYRKNGYRKSISFALSHMLTNPISRPDFLVPEGTHIKSFEVFIITKLFRTKSFVWTVRNEKALNITRAKNMFAIFEIIRP